MTRLFQTLYLQTSNCLDFSLSVSAAVWRCKWREKQCDLRVRILLSPLDIRKRTILQIKKGVKRTKAKTLKVCCNYYFEVENFHATENHPFL